MAGVSKDNLIFIKVVNDSPASNFPLSSRGKLALGRGERLSKSLNEADFDIY